VAPGEALLGEILGIYISSAWAGHRASIGAAWRPARACSVYRRKRESGGSGNPFCCYFLVSMESKFPLKTRADSRAACQNPLQLCPSVYIKIGPKGRIRGRGDEPFLPWHQPLSARIVDFRSALSHFYEGHPP